MWHSDSSRLYRIPELLVAPNVGNLIPAVLLQALYDFSAGHKPRYTLFTHLSRRRSVLPILYSQDEIPDMVAVVEFISMQAA